MSVRVMVFGKLKRLEDQEAFEAQITQVSQHIKGTQGYIGDELLRDPDDPASYIMMSKWSNSEDFLQWERAPIHKQNTSPLRAYWSADVAFKIYEVVSH